MRSEWKHVQLSDVCELIAGFAFKSSHFGNYGNKVIKIADITPPTVSMNGLIGIDLSKYDPCKLERFAAGPGDYVLAMTGATIGKIGRIEHGEAYINQRVLLFKNRKDKVDKDFLYYVLQQYEFRQYILSHIDSESAQPNISAGTIGKFRFTLPQMMVQKRIGRLLRLFDEKVELNHRINENLECQAQAIFAERFMGFTESDLPSGWKSVRLRNVVTIINKSFNPIKEPETLLEHYSIPAFDEARFPVFELSTSIKSNKFIVDADCFMISKLNPTTKRVWRPYCISDKAVCSTEFIVYKAREQRYTDFFYSLIDSESFSGFMCSHVTGSTGSRQRTTPADTLQFEFALPPAEEISAFTAIVQPMYRQMRANAIESDKLKKLRDALLPKLMAGEIN